MKWEMDLEEMEMEMALEKIWDLHDEVSDAFHSISRSHLLQSIRAFEKTSPEMKQREVEVASGGDHGFLLFKGFRVANATPTVEAMSLNSITTALERLEDQFEFFHTVQSQHQAGSDVALAYIFGALPNYPAGNETL